MKKHTKSRTNVSIDSDLLEAARARGMKLSALLEVAIREKLREAASEQWLEENRDETTCTRLHPVLTVGDARHQRTTLSAAIDLLVTGF